MPTYYFHAEVDCGLDVEIEAPDRETARTGAELAMRNHVAEACGHIEVDRVEEFDFEPETVYSYDGRPGSVVMERDRD